MLQEAIRRGLMAKVLEHRSFCPLYLATCSFCTRTVRPMSRTTSEYPESVGDLDGYSNETRPREPRHRSDNIALFGLGRDSSMRRGRPMSRTAIACTRQSRSSVQAGQSPGTAISASTTSTASSGNSTMSSGSAVSASSSTISWVALITIPNLSQRWPLS